LGVRSINEPADIMLKVYQVLKDRDFEWHTISPYHLIVRPKTGPKINIGLNLYQINQSSSTVGYILDFKQISFESSDSATPTSKFSSSNSINSTPHGRSRTSSILNEMFRKRASSYEHQKMARENALKSVFKRWQSHTPEIEEEEKTAAPSNVIDMLQNIELNGCSDSSSSSEASNASNELENLHSELLTFCDNCAKVIHELMN